MNSLENNVSASRSRDWIISAMFLAGSAATPANSGTASTHYFAHATPVSNSDLLQETVARKTSTNAESHSSLLKGWEPVSQTPAWYFELAERIDRLAEKPSGWNGADSSAMSSGLREHAHQFLTKLELEGIDRRPSVGLDYEGTISFTWLDDDLQADLTIFEDGTYSYFAKTKERYTSADAARLSDDFDGHFLSLLLA